MHKFGFFYAGFGGFYTSSVKKNTCRIFWLFALNYRMGLQPVLGIPSSNSRGKWLAKWRAQQAF
jgi:hypothetical protein